MSILVVDVGTSGVRAAVVATAGQGPTGPAATPTIAKDFRRETLPDTPFPGLVEFDATVLAEAVLSAATEATEWAASNRDPVAAVGIATQRASTIVWDRATGVPIAPGLGWQDLRTVGECLTLQAEGLRLAPNQSATKLMHLLANHAAADAGATAENPSALAFGTVDTWVAWVLSGGPDGSRGPDGEPLHVTDATNAGVTGLVTRSEATGLIDWDPVVLDRLGIPAAVLPRIVASTGVVGEASALPGSPPIAALAGDQQSSLIGQSCVRPGLAKITFGTGGMLDVCLGTEPADSPEPRSPNGCFPIVAWRGPGLAEGAHGDVWALEAIMLAAGTNVEWLRDDLGLIPDAAASHEVAASVADTDGVVYVPAPLGLGTPHWDFGARGTLLGLTRGSTAAHVVRAVLEGVAQRGADLVEAAEADAAMRFDTLRVDGGMSANPTFVQALADATQRPIELAPVAECTTLGAAYLAGLATGVWSNWDEVADVWAPRSVVEPAGPADRDRWADAVGRSAHWFEDLSALSF